jgi:rRNA-processing protein FCF1
LDGGRGAAICDANVLIDFAKADEDIFRELVAYWGKVFVPDVVLFEAKQLSLTRAEELGLTIIETPLVLPPGAGLSKADRACLHYVLHRGWTCIVNDRRLRNECRKQGGTVVWGLEMLLNLVTSRRITKARAREIAKIINADNPLITRSILDEFMDKLKKLKVR